MSLNAGGGYKLYTEKVPWVSFRDDPSMLWLHPWVVNCPVNICSTEGNTAMRQNILKRVFILFQKRTAYFVFVQTICAQYGVCVST